MQTLKDEIRESILEVSKKTFIKKGYEKTTMRDIAQGANISVGNIYRYFENKENILDELLSGFEVDLKNYSKELDNLMFSKNDNSSQNNIKTYVKKLQKVFEENETAVFVLAHMESTSKFIKFEERLIDKCSNRILEVNKTSKNKNINKGVADAIACGLIYGIKNIVKRFDKRTNNFDDIKKDLEIYIEITMHDIMLRLRDIDL